MNWFRRKRRVPREIRRALRLLRRRIRIYVLAEGFAAMLIVLGVAFWLGLALDWTFEPSRDVRIAGRWILGLVTAWVVFHYIVLRVFARLRDPSLALLLERRFPQLEERLLTAVELGRRESRDVHPALLEKTTEEARRFIQAVDVRDALNPRPLGRKVLLAALLVVSVIVFGLAEREAFAFYIERLQLSDALWPRRVELSVDEFSEKKTHRIARDSEFTLTVRASLMGDHIAPDEVEIRYQSADGARGRDAFTRIGAAVPGRDRYQLFRYRFKSVAQSLEFDIVGGDDRITGLALEVVDRPQAVDLALDCIYPEYTGKPSETRSVVGPLRLPEGTVMVLHGNSTKPLRTAELHDMDSREEQVVRYDEDAAATAFEFPLPALEADRLLLLSLTDTDGIEIREPVRISLTRIPDDPPEVAVRLTGVGMSVTPDARIPFTGLIEDEFYGAEEAWFEYRANEAEGVTLPLERQPSGATRFEVEAALDLRSVDQETQRRRLTLEPGQSLAIQVMASDRYDLSNEPHVGTSQVFQLEIVTPGQLRAILEQRELSLRQRFEAVFDKMNQTRDLLTRVEFEEGANAATEVESDAEDAADAETNDAQGENAAADELRRRQMRVAGALQNVNQSSHETVGIADGFDEIQEELINNRIDTVELLDRIRNSVGEPLRHIGGELMPRLAERLKSLQAKLEDPQAGREELSQAIRQTDEILVEMQAALDKMLELESYNEVLDLLRGIIRDQEQLQERTKQKQREGLRSLLE